MATYYVDSNAAVEGDGTTALTARKTFPALVASDIVYVARNSVFQQNTQIPVPAGTSGSSTKILTYGKGKKPEFVSSVLTNSIFAVSHSYIQIDDLVTRGGGLGFELIFGAGAVEGEVKFNRLVTHNSFKYGYWHNAGATTTLAGPGVVATYTDCVGFGSRLANFHAPGNTKLVKYIRCKSHSAGRGWPHYSKIKAHFIGGSTSEDLTHASWTTHTTNFSSATYKKTHASQLSSVTVTSEDGVTTFELTQASSLGSGLGYLQWIQIDGVVYLNIGTSPYCGAHGFTCHPIRISVPNIGWTNVSGTLWSSPAVVGEAWSFDPGDGTGSTIRNLLKTAGTQSAPALGEFGQVGTTLYVNATGFNPANGLANSAGTMAYGQWGGIEYIDCISTDTRVNDPTLAEGHGFAADDYATNVTYTRCKSYKNMGLGISSNKGKANNWYTCLVFGNARGGISAPYGRAHNAVHNTVVGNGNTDLNLQSTYFQNFINNISGTNSIANPFSGMRMGAAVKYGNVGMNNGVGGMSSTNGYREVSGPYMYSLGGASASLDDLDGDFSHLDHTEKFNGLPQSVYTGTDINGIPFSRLNPSPGCVQFRQKPRLLQSRLIRGAMDHRLGAVANQGLSVDTPSMSSLTSFTFEVVFRAHKGNPTLLGYTDFSGVVGASPGGFALQVLSNVGPRLFLANSVTQWLAVLNTEQSLSSQVNLIDSNDRGWRHLVVRVNTTHVTPNDRVLAWSNGQVNKGRYWETRHLADYATAFYPTNINAYIPQNTAFTFPKMFIGTNAASGSTFKFQGQMSLVRMWPTALTDQQCEALYRRYFAGKLAEVRPTVELLFQPENFTANTGLSTAVPALHNNPKFSVI